MLQRFSVVTRYTPVTLSVMMGVTKMGVMMGVTRVTPLLHECNDGLLVPMLDNTHCNMAVYPPHPVFSASSPPPFCTAAGVPVGYASSAGEVVVV